MNKKEAFKLIRQQKGYIPYVQIFDLFVDNEEIPQELITISMQKEQANGEIILTPKLAELLKKKQKK